MDADGNWVAEFADISEFTNGPVIITADASDKQANVAVQALAAVELDTAGPMLQALDQRSSHRYNPLLTGATDLADGAQVPAGKRRW